MGHLKYGAGGHLLRNAAGHLVHICEGPTATPTATPTPSPTPTALNDCNSCDPPIPDTLYVTFAGLGGDFAVYNGKHAIPWIGAWSGNPTEDACNWVSVDGIAWIAIYWDGVHWWVQLHAGEARCAVDWRDGVDECDPIGSYSLWACYDSYCDDTTSCENSVGATCVVSLT